MYIVCVVINTSYRRYVFRKRSVETRSQVRLIFVSWWTHYASSKIECFRCRPGRQRTKARKQAFTSFIDSSISDSFAGHATPKSTAEASACRRDTAGDIQYTPRVLQYTQEAVEIGLQVRYKCLHGMAPPHGCLLLYLFYVWQCGVLTCLKWGGKFFLRRLYVKRCSIASISALIG